MKNKYKHTKITVSLIGYHFVFCPRYRRKIFNIPGVEQRFKKLGVKFRAYPIKHQKELINQTSDNEYCGPQMRVPGMPCSA